MPRLTSKHSFWHFTYSQKRKREGERWRISQHIGRKGSLMSHDICSPLLFPWSSYNFLPSIHLDLFNPHKHKSFFLFFNFSCFMCARLLPYCLLMNFQHFLHSLMLAIFTFLRCADKSKNFFLKRRNKFMWVECVKDM